MAKQKGRPKKYKEKEWNTFSLYISEPFKETWKIIKKLSENNKNENFKQYAKQIEDADITSRSKKNLAIYIRWILAQHARKPENLQKIK